MRSNYDLTVVDEFVCILDQDTAVSVTNDAENVIKDLVASGLDLSNRRVIYYDSMGYWDELLVRKNTFFGFAPIRVRNIQEAMSIARKLKR